jgi:hypothetical protein
MMKSNNPDASILDQLLIDVLSSAAEAKIDLWAECGTLLGIVREGDFIPWEDDLDFGADQRTIDTQKIDKFSHTIKRRGYNFTLHDSYWNISLSNSICHADLNFYNFDDATLAIVPLTGPGNSIFAKIVDTVHRIVSQRPLGIPDNVQRKRDVIKLLLQKACRALPAPVRSFIGQFLHRLLERLYIDTSWKVPKDFLNDFQSIDFREVTLQIPSKSKEYLAYRYGDDWNIPRQAYNTWKEDGAIV